MHRQPLREVAHRRLRGRIGRNLGQRHEGAHRRDVDDGTPAPGDHAAGKNLSRQKRAHEIQIEHVAETGGLEVEERLAPSRPLPAGSSNSTEVLPRGSLPPAPLISRSGGPQAVEIASRHCRSCAASRTSQRKGEGGPACAGDRLRPDFCLFQADVQNRHLHRLKMLLLYKPNRFPLQAANGKRGSGNPLWFIRTGQSHHNEEAGQLN